MSKSPRPPVIDMRCRPSYLHEFFGAVPASAEDNTARWINRRVGTRGDDAHYARSRTREGFVAEVEQAGLARAVIVGRNIPGQRISNDLVHRIASDSPRFIGIGAVDPLAADERATLAEVDRAIETLGLAATPL